MPGARKADAKGDRTDWDRLRSLSDSEIERIARDDLDNPATLSDAEWTHAFVGLPPLPQRDAEAPPAKRAIRALFDSDVVDFFQRGGRGYQNRMNAVLRRYMEIRRNDTSDT